MTSAIRAGAVAVITGGASGIGLAAAKKFSSLGLKVCIADRAGLDAARLALPDALVCDVDVSDRETLVQLERTVVARFGGVDVLMNNAGISRPSSALDGDWQALLSTNLWGVIHGCQVFVPGMLARGREGLVINTGSKQGITTPPGNPAYNVSKAGVKVYTEALEHELRNSEGSRVKAHLLVPGFVFTGMTQGARTEKPASAWTPEQTIDFMLERVGASDFYILCPGNDVPRALDEKRIAWAAADLIENRPPLSRWHPAWKEAFAQYIGK